MVVAVGAGVGAVNGLIVARLNVAPFIATLGTLYVARGAALLLSDGGTFPNLAGIPDYGSASFRVLGAGSLLGIPVSIWILAAMALLATYVARQTPLGRYVYAVGGSERGAAPSGVKVACVKMAVHVFPGFCAALVGLIISSQLRASHSATGEAWSSTPSRRPCSGARRCRAGAGGSAAP